MDSIKSKKLKKVIIFGNSNHLKIIIYLVIVVQSVEKTEKQWKNFFLPKNHNLVELLVMNFGLISFNSY